MGRVMATGLYKIHVRVNDNKIIFLDRYRNSVLFARFIRNSSNFHQFFSCKIQCTGQFCRNFTDSNALEYKRWTIITLSISGSYEKKKKKKKLDPKPSKRVVSQVMGCICFQQLIACKHAHLVCYSREYLSGGAAICE